MAGSKRRRYGRPRDSTRYWETVDDDRDHDRDGRWATGRSSDRGSHRDPEPSSRMTRGGPADDDEESLTRIAARRAVRRMKDDAETPEFGRMLIYQAASAAGDALIAIALAGTLFFSIPTAEARGRVALYLALTVAPFAIVAPFLARFLDRSRGRLRATMVIAALGRGGLAWLLSTRIDSLFLFPIAFGILILSRAVLVVRGAALPQLIPEGRALVDANSSLSRIGAIAGMVVGLPGVALLKWPGVGTELLLTAAVYLVGAVAAVGLPKVRGRLDIKEQIGARRRARSVSIRQGLVALSAIRFLVGFLVFHLAFSFRRESTGSVELALLVGAAASGGLLGALIAPRLKRMLKEEGILALALMISGLTGVVVGLRFSTQSAAGLVLAFGITSGSAKVAFDSMVQRETPEGGRGWAFARFESGLQVAWVIGA
ncbi:MAG: MFS transporter, partial [Actinomycetota bacterium]